MMSYSLLVRNYVHPFIIYVLIGTVTTYLLARVLVHFNVFKESRWRVLVYSLPFVVPMAAYFTLGALSTNRCFAFGSHPGLSSSWFCLGGDILATILTPFFISAVLVAFGRLIGAHILAHQYIKRYSYASAKKYPGLFEVLTALCNKVDLPVPDVIVTQHLFAKAFTMGYKSPVLVVSEGLIKGLDSEELETVLAHELGHIVRNDSLMNTLMLFCKDLMFFSPLAVFIYRDFSCEKEKASDDFAIAVTNKPVVLAQAIIKVWRMSKYSLADNFAAYPTFTGQAGILEQRVVRLLGETCIERTRVWLGLAILAVFSIISMLLLYLIC